MYVHGPSETVLLKVPDPFEIRGLLKHSRTVNHPEYNLAVKHALDSTHVLRNMGFDVPAPIRSQYHWPGKFTPFEHQRVMAEFMTMHRRCFNLSEMGSMKTNAALWAADWLMSKGIIRKVLVLSPLSTLDRVWMNDIFETLMHRKAAIAHGSRDKRLAVLDMDLDFYVMNHDGITIGPVFEALRRKPEIDLIIVDEASKFRNASTRKFKALAKLVEPVERRLWLITGTPCPTAPTDAWALARLVSPGRVPSNFGAFKRNVMIQLAQFKWVARPEAYKIAYDAMQPAVRFKKADCIDLPPVTFQSRQCDLTDEQKKAFAKMKQLMQAEAKTKTITAVNAADQIGKLRQILCGAVKDPETDEYVTIPHEPRLNVLLETIEEASAKVLVVVPFKGIIKALQKEVGKSYKVGVLNGDVSPKERDRIIREFKSIPSDAGGIHVLLCHPAVMSHGLNLTEADTLIFYGPIYSNDEYLQVLERFNRAGQVNSMTVVKMAAHPLEWDIYKLLDSRGASQNNILNLYQAITE